MLHSAHRVRGATIAARDGEIGTVEDFYVDEDSWTVRYVVVNTGSWLNSRRVLVSPMSVSGPWGMTAFPVSLTKQQVEDSPTIDLGRPLSRGSESDVLGHYGYPMYWGAGGVWGSYDNPAALASEPVTPPPSPTPAHGESRVDPDTEHVRSTTALTGRHLLATDGEIGHVDDFFIDEKSWRVRYLLVDTSNWIGGKSVVITPDALKPAGAAGGPFQLKLTREQVKQSRTFESIESEIALGETGPPITII